MIREIQIKITEIAFPTHHVGKSVKPWTHSVGEALGKQARSQCWWECKMVRPPSRGIWPGRCLHLPCELTVPFLGWTSLTTDHQGHSLQHYLWCKTWAQPTWPSRMNERGTSTELCSCKNKRGRFLWTGTEWFPRFTEWKGKYTSIYVICGKKDWPLYDSSSRRLSASSNYTDRSRMVVAWGRENGEFGKMKKNPGDG